MMKYQWSTKVPGYDHVFLVKIINDDGSYRIGYQFSDECQTFLSSPVYDTAERAYDGVLRYIQTL